MECGGEVRKVKWVGRRGAPDRLLLLPPIWTEGSLIAYCAWVELKAPGKKPEPHQEREHKRLRDFWQCVLVIDSIEQIEALLDPWTRMKRSTQ